MHFITRLALFAGLATAVVGQEEEVSLEERAHCSPVQIVALGGEGTTHGDLGLFQSTMTGIQNEIPGSVIHQIGYPAGDDSPDAIAFATPVLRKHLHEYVAACPHSKIVTAGYSAGAAAVMNVLCGDAITGDDPLPTRFRHHIIANIVYGDPTFTPGLAYEVGGCTLPGDVPRAFPEKCFPFGKKTKSYCDPGDETCCSGNDPNVHFSYPGIYDGDVAKFVKAKYHFFKTHHKH